MKVHKSITKQSLHLVLNALMECGAEDAPVIVSPGTYHGRPAIVLAVHDGNGTLAPLAVVLDPESDDAAYLTIEGTTPRGPGAPSPVGSEAPTGRVLDVLEVLLGYAESTTDGARPVEHMRDARALIEQARRRPVAPVAPVAHTGLYL